MMEHNKPIDHSTFTHAIRQLLVACGVDPAGADFVDTPKRVTEIWSMEFVAGYGMHPAKILGSPLTKEADPDVVIVRDLAFHSMCPHHLLPYQGRAHVAYMPSGKLVGFGRLAQLVACFTRRLTLQERATHQVATALMEHLGARGAACVMEAKQLCLGIPNDQHAANQVITSAFLGEFLERGDLRQRVLNAAPSQ